MPPRKLVTVTVRDQTFTFTPALVDDLPELKPFLSYLLDADRVSTHIAAMYVKLVGRLRRQGRLADVDLIHHRNERTAANAFLKWQRETYALRVREVARAFTGHNIADRIRFLRRHSISPPFHGKVLPIAAMPTPVTGSLAENFPVPDPMAPPRLRSVDAPDARANIAWVPADTKWSLHVPMKFVAPHADPCPDCTAIELDESQLEVIATVFEKAWGHRDLALVSPETYLFGAPPPEGTDLTVVERVAGEKAVALVSQGTVRADDMGRIGVNVVGMEHFFERLAEGADGVYLSRAACGAGLGDVLGALWKVWGTAG